MVDFPPRFAQLNGKVLRQVTLQHTQVAVHYLSWWLPKANSSVLRTALRVTCGALQGRRAELLASQFAFELHIHSSCLLSVAIFYVYLQKSSCNSLFSRQCKYSESKLNCIAAIVRQASCSNTFAVCPHILWICISNFHEKQASKTHSDNKVLTLINERNLMQRNFTVIAYKTKM